MTDSPLFSGADSEAGAFSGTFSGAISAAGVDSAAGAGEAAVPGAPGGSIPPAHRSNRYGLAAFLGCRTPQLPAGL